MTRNLKPLPPGEAARIIRAIIAHVQKNKNRVKFNKTSQASITEVEGEEVLVMYGFLDILFPKELLEIANVPTQDELVAALIWGDTNPTTISLTGDFYSVTIPLDEKKWTKEEA